jgi:hypothetical protein
VTPSEETRLAGKPARASLRTHLFVAATIVAVLVGGGLRLVPTGNAALPGASASATGGASTACSAQ